MIKPLSYKSEKTLKAFNQFIFLWKIMIICLIFTNAKSFYKQCFPYVQNCLACDLDNNCVSCSQPLVVNYESNICDSCSNVYPGCLTCSYPDGIAGCYLCDTVSPYGPLLFNAFQNPMLSDANYIFQSKSSLDNQKCSFFCPGNSDDSNQDGICDCDALITKPYINSNGDNCVASCQKCQAVSSLSLISGNLQCVKTCKPFFLNIEGKQCVLSCGPNQCPNQYNQCACRIGSFKVGCNCIDRCPLDTFLNIARNKCIRNCGPNQVKVYGACYCQFGYFINQTTQTCVNQCRIYDQEEGKCVDSCSSKFLSIDNSSICISYQQCDKILKTKQQINIWTTFNEVCQCSQNQYFHQDLKKCVSECGCHDWNGYYINYKLQMCLKCTDQNCLTCTQLGRVCQKCKRGYTNNNGVCTTTSTKNSYDIKNQVYPSFAK